MTWLRTVDTYQYIVGAGSVGGLISAWIGAPQIGCLIRSVKYTEGGGPVAARLSVPEFIFFTPLGGLS